MQVINKVFNLGHTKTKANPVELVSRKLVEHKPRPLGWFRRQIQGQFMCIWKFVMLF